VIKDLVQQEYKMKVSLVCIAKDEDNYIEEWVNYHLKLGFDNIYIYENDWKCKLSNDKVIKFSFSGKKKQIEAYNHFIQNYHHKQDWIAFFDVDEFLVLKKHDNVKDFLNDYCDCEGVGINWVFFGSNGLKKVENNSYSVLERFTKKQKEPNKHIKSFIKSNKKYRMGVHNPNHRICDTNKTIVYGPFVGPNVDIAQLNHYFTKSYDEFKLKINRGRSDTGNFRNINEFNGHDHNDIEDTDALNFYKK
jgi:hypothetical protein